jgi:magnesium chelatase accessory protein
MDWRRDGVSWPNRQWSRFVAAGGLTWHVQVAGEGPPLLLVHGTAASTHSWREVMPRLVPRFRTIAVDLPGHGFSTAPTRADGFSLPGMAGALADLMAALGADVEIAVGHSAGAAILIEAALDRRLAPKAIVAINGALLPFHGIGRHLFPTLARLIFVNPLVPPMVAWRASQENVVARLIESTGSRIDAEGLALYRRLMSDRGHIGAALGMMAGWDLEALERRLPRLAVPLTLVVGDNDTAVPPEAATRVRALLPSARIETMRGSGHLAHEERPEEVARLIEALALGQPAVG